MARISRIAPLFEIAAAAIVASSCAPAGQSASSAGIPELNGRTAGKPQRCIPIRQSESLRAIDSHTALYGSGPTIWVNRLTSECPGTTRMDILVVEATGAQYCRGDRIRPIDPVSRFAGPVCGLGDFVPYTR